MAEFIVLLPWWGWILLAIGVMFVGAVTFLWWLSGGFND